MSILVRLIVAGLVMGLLDFLWLGFIAKNLYASELGKLLLEKPNMIAAIVFYAIYVIGVVVFVVSPALANGSLWSAVGYGALFGLVAYATYDLTNLATVNGFTLKVAIIDMCWGALITATTSGVTYFVISKWIA
ncbi:MAG: DUF2177 family protein [Candidatus Saccharibacteria bacterium]